jgi:neurofibromin 1
MSTLLVDAYIGDQNPQRRAIESPSSINTICNVLNFLDASPMTLFEGPPTDRVERDRFYQENFESLLTCVVAANDSIRRLATGVAKRLFNEPVLATLRLSKCLESHSLKMKFWRLS